NRYQVEPASGHQSGSNDAVLEGKRREAYGIVLDVEIFQAELVGETIGGDQRRATYGVRRLEIFRDRKKFGVAPHVEVAGSEVVAAHALFDGGVVEGDFEWRETVFAERARSVPPSLATLFTT